MPHTDRTDLTGFARLMLNLTKILSVKFIESVFAFPASNLLFLLNLVESVGGKIINSVLGNNCVAVLDFSEKIGNLQR